MEFDTNIINLGVDYLNFYGVKIAYLPVLIKLSTDDNVILLICRIENKSI